MCHPYFKPAIQKLEEFKVLSPNWDSYGAERITDTAIMTAKRLLLALQDRLENELDFERPWLDLSRTSPSPLTPYWVVPLPSGGVQMEWQGPESEIEVEIDGVGNLGYLRIVRMEPNVQSFQEEEQATLPNIIHHILETLSVDV
jgi:hypothetical protein